MSAPDTNIEKQTKRHKAPLVGMGSVVVFAGILFIGLLYWTFSQADAVPANTVPPTIGTSD